MTLLWWYNDNDFKFWAKIAVSTILCVVPDNLSDDQIIEALLATD